MKNINGRRAQCAETTRSAGRSPCRTNTGPSDKFVSNNSGAKNLQLRRNALPFVGSANIGFAKVKGSATF
jgi:hypothetical protein